MTKITDIVLIPTINEQQRELLVRYAARPRSIRPFEWTSFCKGYIREVGIFRDLEASGISFEAHNLMDKRQRFEPFDLTVSAWQGDIKTSTYFLLLCPFGVTKSASAISVLSLNYESKS